VGLDQIAAVVGAVDGRRVVGSQVHRRVRVPDAPPSTYALQSIERSALTVHDGVPDVRCELPGAFAELKLSAVGVYVPGATAAEAAAGNAMAATSAVAMARSFLIM
jgi:hypothetical protein